MTDNDKKKNPNGLDEFLDNGLEPDLIKWDGCDKAIIGVGYRCGQHPMYVYDYPRLVEVFTDQGMTQDEAEEWVDFNIVGAWVGESTPIIMYNI